VAKVPGLKAENRQTDRRQKLQRQGSLYARQNAQRQNNVSVRWGRSKSSVNTRRRAEYLISLHVTNRKTECQYKYLTVSYLRRQQEIRKSVEVPRRTQSACRPVLQQCRTENMK